MVENHTRSRLTIPLRTVHNLAVEHRRTPLPEPASAVEAVVVEDGLDDNESDAPDFDDDMTPIFYQGRPRNLVANRKPLQLHIQDWADPLRTECNHSA